MVELKRIAQLGGSGKNEINYRNSIINYIFA